MLNTSTANSNLDSNQQWEEIETKIVTIKIQGLKQMKKRYCRL